MWPALPKLMLKGEKYEIRVFSSASQLMAHAVELRTMLALARDVFGHAASKPGG